MWFFLLLWLSQSSGDPLDQGGPADLSETGMFDLVEVPFFHCSYPTTWAGIYHSTTGETWGTSLD